MAWCIDIIPPKRNHIMPATKNFIIYLPLPLHKRLEEYLWSDVQGRIPHGAVQKFFQRLLSEFFESRRLDLGPYLNTIPGDCVIHGSDATLNKLINHLKEVKHDADKTS